jgi:hypothetical protein
MCRWLSTILKDIKKGDIPNIAKTISLRGNKITLLNNSLSYQE